MKKLMKIVAILACAAILVAGSVAGTFAYLAMKTESVANTFTVGNINITLENTTPSNANTKMVPGQTVAYEATVTVVAESEACWLFVKIDQAANFAEFFDAYSVADGWTVLDGQAGVYYRAVSESDSNQGFYVIKDNQLKANKDTGKAAYDSLQETTKPTLTITAYAIQQVGFNTAAAAWNQVKDLSGPSSNSNYNYAATT